MLVRIAEKLKTSVGELVGETNSTPIDTPLLKKLGARGAIELLDVYDRIQDPKLQVAVIQLTRAMVDHERKASSEI